MFVSGFFQHHFAPYSPAGSTIMLLQSHTTYGGAVLGGAGHDFHMVMRSATTSKSAVERVWQQSGGLKIKL